MNIFDAIRNDDFEKVKAFIEADPSKVNAVAPLKPADTKRMSPLQVALTTGWHRKIAWYLLEKGADVNYIEPPDHCLNSARPVICDAAEVAVRNARRIEKDEETGEYRMIHSKEDADEAFAFLKAVVEHGADLKKTDYYNNGVMSKAIFAADCTYPDPRYTGRKHCDEQDEDLLRIFHFLINSGADRDTVSSCAKKTCAQIYADHPVWALVGHLIDPKSDNPKNAKRGYLPDDARNFGPKAMESLRAASRHLFYLINEGYDITQASTFVGNHFVLSDRQRMAIARSLSGSEQLKNRKEKEKTEVSGEEVWIDGFNTVITLEVMLSDSLLFRCMDGTIRDLAALRGSYRIIPETREAVSILLHQLEEMKVTSVHILLDEPVSNSGRLKSLIADLGEGSTFSLDIQLLKQVDRALWDKENVISADAIILDHCKSWINLVKNCVEKRNAPTLQLWA